MKAVHVIVGGTRTRLTMLTVINACAQLAMLCWGARQSSPQAMPTRSAQHTWSELAQKLTPYNLYSAYMHHPQ